MLCMYVCIYVYIYVYMYICVYVYMYICIYRYMSLMYILWQFNSLLWFPMAQLCIHLLRWGPLGV